MLTLAIESSTKIASVTIASGDQILGTIVSDNPKTHSEFLNSAIDRLLALNSLKIDSLSRVCVSIGPGSFTGIRVGIAIAKTISYFLRIPIYAVDTLSCLAEGEFSTDAIIVPVLNAQKNLVYWAAYETDSSMKNGKKVIISARCSSIPELMDFIQKQTKVLKLIGDGVSILQKQFDLSLMNSKFEKISADLYPKSELLAQIGIQWEKNVQPIDWKLIEPLYIRNSEAEENLRIKS